MRMAMNTALSGSGRIDSTHVLPLGELRGLTKLIKITEDVRKYAAEQGISEEETLVKGMEQKATEYRRAGAGRIDSQQTSPEGSGAGEQPNQFAETGAEIYSKA
jgi:hypothetical protein